MANELRHGARRVGDLIDFNPDTPQLKVALEHSDRGIGITVPWSTENDPYASWFLRDEGFIRIPPREESLPAPKRVLFQDSYGTVLLIGCHARGYHSTMGGPGSGTLWARAAVLGVRSDVDFEYPHGLQTEIGGLRAWLGTTSWSEMTKYRDRFNEVTVQSLAVPDLEVGEYHGTKLSITFGWAIRRECNGDRRILTDIARCLTRSDRPTSWSDHLKVHHAVRDLMVLSRWQYERCVEVRTLHLDDPLRTIDGVPNGEQWREVVLPEQETHALTSARREYLIKYADLGAEGLLSWIAMRDDFARALDPVISSIRLRQTSASTLLAQVGPGLEALGYLLLLRDGVSKAEAANSKLRTRFERILADLGDCLPFDGERWTVSATSAYNGLKHANRVEPDPVDVINAWRECVLVTRAWVAVELGVPIETVRERLELDPQRNSYVKLE